MLEILLDLLIAARKLIQGGRDFAGFVQCSLEDMYY